MSSGGIHFFGSEQRLIQKQDVCFFAIAGLFGKSGADVEYVAYLSANNLEWGSDKIME